MLVDDNKDDNFYHERIIKKGNSADHVIAMQSGDEALDFLKNKIFEKNTPPDLIFLDINMPGMNGWEFLEEYNKLDKEKQSKLIVVMLTTSDNPDDITKARTLSPVPLKDFKTKPLTQEMLQEIINKYYKDINPGL
jgi:CheY-like chemotaxis protein